MSTDPGTLSAERILDTAEEVLRRFGPAKASVLDVARALGVSHGSVYRHFPSKAALRARSRNGGWPGSPHRWSRSPPARARPPTGCAGGCAN